MNPSRIHLLKRGVPRKGKVLYWMSRDQRAQDNWALLFAQQQALERETGLMVVFCLVPQFLGATLRQYAFMLKGLAETARDLHDHDIPFTLIVGQPADVIPDFIRQQDISFLVSDFDPLKIKRRWQAQVARRITIPFYEVDAHNIVPCRAASSKAEFGAYTLRSKIHRLFDEYLDAFPRLRSPRYKWKKKLKLTNPLVQLKTLRIDRDVTEVPDINPGPSAGQRRLKDFIRYNFAHYPTARNDPNQDGQSGLSPYLHFGQLSAQRVAQTVMTCSAPRDAREAFLEELIVRRELSDNFCFYHRDYDSASCFPQWAKTTLQQHARDRRPYIYRRRDWEQARTHDPLWNAAQRQMMTTGKMHGYLRMYWAKKILEWSPNPQSALRTAIMLNDRYELDGRDPNGYAGLSWSIGGVHDRAWGERPVFGKIRYMSYNGCKSKFDIERYIREYGN